MKSVTRIQPKRYENGKGKPLWLPFVMAISCLWLIQIPYVLAQESPRISAIFPSGGKIGKAVEVSIQGSDLDGAHTLIIEGEPGITGELFATGGKVDDTYKELYEQTCTECHELRSPSNRSMTPAQWGATVMRMINEKNAAINPDDRDKIVSYLKSAARASGGLTARLTIASDAAVGTREIRIVGKKGTSTAWPFEISQQEEGIDTEPNDTMKEATAVELPMIVNGVIGTGADQDYYAFHASSGDRYVFNVKAYRLNNISQQFFQPTISLLDSQGVELARSNGFYSLDPLIDYKIQTDGTYYLRIRDLLYRGNPSSVYRLTMGVIPYNTYLFPAGGQIGRVIEGVIGGQNLPETSHTIDLTKDTALGLKQIFTPYGIFPFIASDALEMVEMDILDMAGSIAESTERRDVEGEILFQTKCTRCHESRSPDNRALSAEEWSSTITRMTGKENADISPLESSRIITFIQAETRRLGELMAQQIQHAQMLDVPGAVSGRISENGEVDYYKFTIPEGRTLGPWWVIQPFPNDNETGFQTVYPPETEVDFEKEYVGKNGRKIGWYRSDGIGESVFSNVPEDDVTGYAVTYLDSDRDQIEILSLGSDDGVKIWVNDQLIFSKYIHRSLRAADDVIALPVSKGRNKILIKIINGYGPWGFFATIGGYSIDLSAEQINSPLSPSLTLFNEAGQVLANNAGFGGRRNARIDYSFSEPGTYALRVEDIAANGGNGYIYHLSIEPTTPDFAISVTPDNPNIGRGGTVLLTVQALRRVGFTGEIDLQVENLPPGVKASSSALSRKMNQGYITLTATPDAALGYAVVQVVGAIKIANGEAINRTATPVEVYRIQNQALTVQRSSIVVSVTEAPDLTLSVSPQEVIMTPGKQISLKVKANRNRTGSRRDLTLTVVGLPTDVQLQRNITILRGNETETTLVLEPNIILSGTNQLRRNPFVGEQIERPYNIVVNASVGQRIVASSPAIQLSIGQEPSP